MLQQLFNSDACGDPVNRRRDGNIWMRCQPLSPNTTLSANNSKIDGGAAHCLWIVAPSAGRQTTIDQLYGSTVQKYLHRLPMGLK
jgi:hypothetical protein